MGGFFIDMFLISAIIISSTAFLGLLFASVIRLVQRTKSDTSFAMSARMRAGWKKIDEQNNRD